MSKSGSADWWAQKLNGAAPSHPRAVAPLPRTPTAPVTAQGEPERPSKAVSARQTDTCPECYSDHYFSVQQGRPRCYDCGYPIVQTGSGISSFQSEGTATPTRQVSTGSRFNPVPQEKMS